MHGPDQGAGSPPMKAWIVILCLGLSACGTANREMISIHGRISFLDEAPPPPGYVLHLSETRSPSVLSRYFTVALIAPSADGSFSIDAFVCENVSVTARFAGGVGGRRDDPIWNSPIEIVADEAETARIRSSHWPLDSYEEQARRDADEFARRAAELGGAQRVPC